jgi:RNA polymerase sigma-70 factor, ECF subfamily
VSKYDLPSLVDEHYDRLFRAALFLTGSTTVAEDLVQDTFLVAVKSLKGFKGRSAVYTWLYGILYNKYRQWLRRREKHVLSLDAGGADTGDRGGTRGDFLASGAPQPLDLIQGEERAEQVRSAVAALSTDHRIVVTMRFVEGLAYKEISRIVGSPVGTIKSRMHYALAALAEMLGEPFDPAAH